MKNNTMNLSEILWADKNYFIELHCNKYNEFIRDFMRR